MGTEYAKDNLSLSNSNLHIYTDSLAVMKAIIGQRRESYHNSTIKNPRENLMSICQMVDEIKLVYCPALKGIPKHETADNLAKVVSKKAKHLPQMPEMTKMAKEMGKFKI